MSGLRALALPKRGSIDAGALGGGAGGHACDWERSTPSEDSKAEFPTTGTLWVPVVLLPIVMEKGCGRGIWNSVQQLVSLGERAEVCTESSEIEPKFAVQVGASQQVTVMPAWHVLCILCQATACACACVNDACMATRPEACIET